MSGDQEPKIQAGSDDTKPDYVKLKCVGNDGNEIHFRVKISSEFTKVKSLYSERVGAPVQCLRFLYDGKRINDDDTPKTLQMIDDDIIEVYQEQLGGYL